MQSDDQIFPSDSDPKVVRCSRQFQALANSQFIVISNYKFGQRRCQKLRHIAIEVVPAGSDSPVVRLQPCLPSVPDSNVLIQEMASRRHFTPPSVL